MKTYIFSFFAFSILLQSATVEAQELKYPIIVFTENYTFRSSIDDCGTVIIEAKKKVRKKRIYRTNSGTGTKDDSSCVWINGMYDAVEGLVIQNENGDVFELDYETLKVSSLGNQTKEEFHSIGKFLERTRKRHMDKEEKAS